MKTHEFQIPLYKVSVLLVQIEGPDDIGCIERLCKEHEIEVTQTLMENVTYNKKNGGDTYRDLDRREIIVFFYPFSSQMDRVNVLCHEKRHIEDRVLNYFGVNDVESAAMLSGYLGEKFYQFIKLT